MVKVGNRGGEMTAVVSRERAKTTWLTAVAGLLILAAAFVMMACAAPSVMHARPLGAQTKVAGASASWMGTDSWSARRAGAAGQDGP
jgi:hypothetical protein